jgi:hypothetical protein
MASEDEVEAQRERVLELRARVEEARSGGDQTLQELDNEIVLVQLQGEEAKLQAELDALNAQTNDTALVRGASAPLSAAKNAMALAVAQQEAIADKVAADNRAAAPAAPPVVGPADAEAPIQTAAEAKANKAPTNKNSTEG